MQVHYFENSKETQSHLDLHRDKFQSDCVFILSLLYRGEVLTEKILVQKYDIACGGRRLRELYAARSDIKRDWVYDEGGKNTRYKKYWMEIPKQTTKTELTTILGKKLMQGELLYD